MALNLELSDFTGDDTKRQTNAWTAPYAGAWHSPESSIGASDFVLIAFKVLESSEQPAHTDVTLGHDSN